MPIVFAPSIPGAAARMVFGKVTDVYYTHGSVGWGEHVTERGGVLVNPSRSVTCSPHLSEPNTWVYETPEQIRMSFL
ncbi:MAG: hypothetical protein LBL66_01730 [Clostridiales bacterium]|jgi:hypothetical protein|nr:hypothetical protein [Clostridiales bacterium]